MPDRKINLGIPQPKQEEFLRSKEKYLCYGGGRGGGKSWVLRFAAKLYALKYPGIRQLIVRRSYPELNENHILPLRSETEGICTFRDREKSLFFPNGSRIKFSYCANPGDERQFSGQEWDIIYLDEAQQLPESAFSALRATLRGVNSFPKRFFLFCNPGDVGMPWIRRLFVERDFNENENPSDYRFIQALISDNRALLDADPGYLSALKSLSPSLRSAWLDGDWYSFEGGRFFPEFKPSLHTVDPFPIPPDFRLYRSLDYGLDMLAVLWIAVSSTGEEFVYRELHRPGLIASEAAEEILRLSEGEKIECTFAPPDLWHRSQDTGLRISDLFASHGVPFVRSNSERIGGWQALKEHLRPLPGPDGSQTSRLKIFRSCGTLIKHLQLLPIDDRNPCDASVEPHELTHICDALRYFCSMRTFPPRSPRPPLTESQRLARLKKAALKG